MNSLCPICLIWLPCGCVVVLAEPRGFNSSLFSIQIHAYNLETNTWEEIATKPHEKVGESAISHHILYTREWLGCVKVLLAGHLEAFLVTLWRLALASGPCSFIASAVRINPAEVQLALWLLSLLDKVR